MYIIKSLTISLISPKYSVEVTIRRISKDVRYLNLSANINPVFIVCHKNLKPHILQIQIQTL